MPRRSAASSMRMHYRTFRPDRASYQLTARRFLSFMPSLRVRVMPSAGAGPSPGAHDSQPALVRRDPVGRRVLDVVSRPLTSHAAGSRGERARSPQGGQMLVQRRGGIVDPAGASSLGRAAVQFRKPPQPPVVLADTEHATAVLDEAAGKPRLNDAFL